MQFLSTELVAYNKAANETDTCVDYRIFRYTFINFLISRMTKLMMLARVFFLFLRVKLVASATIHLFNLAKNPSSCERNLSPKTLLP